MSSTASNRTLSPTAIFCTVLLVAGCGGSGGDEPKPELEHEHEAGSTEHPLHGHLVAPPPLANGELPPAAEIQIIEGRVSGQVPTMAADEVIALAPTFTPLIKGTYHNSPYWPTWYGNGKPVDGVACLTGISWHKHVLISIYKDGKRLGFQDGVGRFRAGCYSAYEMHTHDVTGLIHMEANAPRNFKLGQWFNFWQQPLSRTNAAGLAGPVRFYIIEKGIITRYDGNPYDIAMAPNREILIVTGFALSVVPKYQWPLGI